MTEFEVGFRRYLEENILYPTELAIWSRYLHEHPDCDSLTVFGAQHLVRFICTFKSMIYIYMMSSISGCSFSDFLSIQSVVVPIKSGIQELVQKILEDLLEYIFSQEDLVKSMQ